MVPRAKQDRSHEMDTRDLPPLPIDLPRVRDDAEQAPLACHHGAAGGPALDRFIGLNPAALASGARAGYKPA